MTSGDGGIQAVKGARNHALWREVNERIKAVAETSSNVEFLCECGRLDCAATIELSMAEYERIRASSVRFPIAPGHEIPEIEVVLETNDRYAVVEKLGDAARVVAERDRRSR
jgi:hypothetical protein